MPETKDPVAALDAPDIPTRAAGARDLALAGTPEVVDRLLAMAKADKSPGVRLACAAAAADIASRDRLSGSIPEDTRRRWLLAIQGADPGLNAGLFQVAAVLSLPEAVNRIVVGLRDPRHDVRAGACVGLWRLVASAEANGDAALEARVVAALDDKRARVETRVEIARICAAAGFLSALEPARRAAEESIRNTRKLADETVDRLQSPPTGVGIYVDVGIDNGEARPPGKPRGYMALLSATDCVTANASVSRHAPGGPMRVMSGKLPGEEAASAVVQVGRSTYWAADGDDLCAFGDRLLAKGAFDLLDACEAVIGTSAAGLRVRGAALLARGDAKGALEALEDSVAGKKVPSDAWWFLAEALHVLGRDDEARPNLEKYLAKAAKKAPFVEEAKRRLGG